MAVLRARRVHVSPRTPRGFSLLELLICLAIIGVLICIMTPALSRARSSARRLACAAQLRSIALATAAHATSHGSLPVSNDTQRLEVLELDPRVWTCPDARSMPQDHKATSYAYLGITQAFPAPDFSNPSSIRGDVALRLFENHHDAMLYKEIPTGQRHHHAARFDGSVLMY
jgi:prepilin-type N-terminal cleavage/methylation domain-containing protein